MTTTTTDPTLPVPGANGAGPSPDGGTIDDERARGRQARRDVPRAANATWVPPAGRPDPVVLLVDEDVTRSPDLVPIRHGRMASSAFAFYRGAAVIMAADLATTPSSGLRTQLCGDAHLSNFGVFASPERRLVFDLNDFDETLPGPWEWDLKRLATSFVIAGRDNGFGARQCADAARSCASSYRNAMRSFAKAGVLDTWYAQIDVDEIARAVAERAPRKASRAMDRAVEKARSRTSTRAVRKFATVIDGKLRLVDDPPLIVSLETIAGPDHADELRERVTRFFDHYRESLPDDRRHLLAQFRVADIAHKVVGVGSVGTRAFIVLLTGRGEADPLVLQFKEASASALEPYAGPSPYEEPGQRVVEGQRLMQTSSDLFLGWSASESDGRHYYWRQLMDMKGSSDVGALSPRGLGAYAQMCGWTLARAHARSGSPVAIGAYLGRKPVVDDAIAAFASAYADQNALDYAAHAQAIADGRVAVRVGV